MCATQTAVCVAHFSNFAHKNLTESELCELCTQETHRKKVCHTNGYGRSRLCGTLFELCTQETHNESELCAQKTHKAQVDVRRLAVWLLVRLEQLITYREQPDT